MSAILVVVEHREGAVRKPSLEAVSQAKRMATTLGGGFSVVAMGPGAEHVGRALSGYGAEKVFVVDQPWTTTYSSEGLTAAVENAAKIAQAKWIFFSATSLGRDIGPRVSARLGTGFISDCTEMVVEGGELICTRPVYAGKAFAKVKILKSPAVITLRPNVFGVNPLNGSGTPQVESLALTPPTIRTTFVERKAQEGGKLELTEAEIIVSGGRGLKATENFHLVEDLAAAIGAAVGASRAVVDAGWRPHEIQVGQTGKTVSPTVYIACGISGAIQHLAGMSSSKHIIAINKDPDAPIFKMADFGVVGDVFEILPKLTEAIKHAKSAH